MTTLMQASHQWATRPSDQRFTSLLELDQHCQNQKDRSAARVLPNRGLHVAPVESDNKALVCIGPNGGPVNMTHWSFGQMAQLGGAPAAYLRTLPTPVAADCLNYGLHVARDVEDCGVLLYKNGGPAELRAVTGPNYGRVWNADITRSLIARFGDGLTGDFKIPGEFGKRVQITKENTTLYASDRDMFVFLADEEHRIEMPGRRNGETGSLARGFFVWNSEVGKTSLGVSTFLFDYVCCNRIVWGAQDVSEIRINHTSGAPARFLEEVTPALQAYATSSTAGIKLLLSQARAARIENVDDFLMNRFSKSQSAAISAAHLADEGRPIETLWDAATGITAYARGIAYQDARIEIEREAGKVLKLAA